MWSEHKTNVLKVFKILRLKIQGRAIVFQTNVKNVSKCWTSHDRTINFGIIFDVKLKRIQMKQTSKFFLVYTFKSTHYLRLITKWRTLSVVKKKLLLTLSIIFCNGILVKRISTSRLAIKQLKSKLEKKVQLNYTKFHGLSRKFIERMRNCL